MDDHLSYFEKRLANEVKEIEAKIKELEAERSALSRQLAKARADREGIKIATRKNSTNRILAENAVLEALRNSKKPLQTFELFAKAQLTNFDLKETTFRSYLHRMKSRGEIVQAGRNGRWKIPSQQ